MTNQQIFEALSNAESETFYAWTDSGNDISPEVKATLEAAHAAAKKALVEFAKATGCHW